MGDTLDDRVGLTIVYQQVRGWFMIPTESQRHSLSQSAAVVAQEAGLISETFCQNRPWLWRNYRAVSASVRSDACEMGVTGLKSVLWMRLSGSLAVVPVRFKHQEQVKYVHIAVAVQVAHADG